MQVSFLAHIQVAPKKDLQYFEPCGTELSQFVFDRDSREIQLARTYE
jgi:hypothetical protein